MKLIKQNLQNAVDAWLDGNTQFFQSAKKRAEAAELQRSRFKLVGKTKETVTGVTVSTKGG